MAVVIGTGYLSETIRTGLFSLNGNEGVRPWVLVRLRLHGRLKTPTTRFPPCDQGAGFGFGILARARPRSQEISFNLKGLVGSLQSLVCKGILMRACEQLVSSDVESVCFSQGLYFYTRGSIFTLNHS